MTARARFVFFQRYAKYAVPSGSVASRGKLFRGPELNAKAHVGAWLAVLSESRVGLRNVRTFRRGQEELARWRTWQNSSDIVGGRVKIIPDQATHLDRVVLIQGDAAGVIRSEILAPFRA